MAYQPLHAPPPSSMSFWDDSDSTDGGPLSPDPLPWSSLPGPEPTGSTLARVWSAGPLVEAGRGVGSPEGELAPGAWKQVLDTFHVVRQFSSGASDTSAYLAVDKAAYEAARKDRHGRWEAINIKKLLRVVKIRHAGFDDPKPSLSAAANEGRTRPPFWEIFVSNRPAVQRIIKKGNAVPITHIGDNDDWFATPYGGVSLDAFCRELRYDNVPFSIPLAWHIFHEAIRTVSTLQDGVEKGGRHRNPDWHSVIHSDLYGQNMLLDRGPTGRVKPVVIDWGRAITNEDPKNGTISWKGKARDSRSVAYTMHGAIHLLDMRDSGEPGTDYCDCAPDEIEAVGYDDRIAERKMNSFLQRFTQARHSLYQPSTLTARRGLRRMDDKLFWDGKGRKTHASKRVTLPESHKGAYDRLLPDYADVLLKVENQRRAARGEDALAAPVAAPAPTAAAAPAPPPLGMLLQGRMTRGKRRRDVEAGASNTQTFDGHEDPERLLKRRRRLASED